MPEYLQSEATAKSITNEVFTIINNRLDMCVTMRSNDLWYGFCNDQYQFSKLQHYVWNRLGKDIEIGTYFHFAHNLHLYNDKITK